MSDVFGRLPSDITGEKLRAKLDDALVAAQRQEAEIARLRAQVAEQEATIRRLQDSASKDAETFGERVRAAVEAERDACAKVADGIREEVFSCHQHELAYTAECIASAIRNRTEGGE